MSEDTGMTGYIWLNEIFTIIVLLRAQLTQERDQVAAVLTELNTQMAAVSASGAAARERATQLQQQADILAREAQHRNNEATAMEQRVRTLQQEQEAKKDRSFGG